MTTAKKPANKVHTSERLFQAQVIQLAKLNGWLVFHPRKMQTQDGRWLTAVQGDAGFPDLVFAHPGGRGVIYKLTDLQKHWTSALKLNGAEMYVWFPNDIDAIAQRLASARP
jgi:hypothetical protein